MSQPLNYLLLHERVFMKEDAVLYSTSVYDALATSNFKEFIVLSFILSIQIPSRFFPLFASRLFPSSLPDPFTISNY